MKKQKRNVFSRTRSFPKGFLAIILYCKNDYRVKGSYDF